jgi:hypothetical protein
MVPPAENRPSLPVRNRRLSRRIAARRSITVVCRRGSMDLGKDIAVKMLDISEDGIRLLLREAVQPKEEVCLTLSSIALVRSLKRMGNVAWAVASADGTFCAGVRLQKRLPYADLSRLVRP